MATPRGHQKYDYPRASLGEAVRQVRTARGWSQEALAARVGVVKGTISHVEQGHRSLPGDQLRRLLETITDTESGTALSRPELLRRVPKLDAIWAGLEEQPPLLLPLPDASASRQTRQPREAPAPASHEELVQLFTRQSNWSSAARHAVLAAELAEHRGDWAGWTRYLLNAGHNEMNLGRFEDAASRFRAILDKPAETGQRARAEAFVRLGWLSQRQEDHRGARQFLSTGLSLASALPEAESPLGIIEDAQHLLGRTYVDSGEIQGARSALEHGRSLLRTAFDLAERRGQTASMGYSLLRQIPALADSDAAAAERALDEGADLIAVQPTAQGHLNLYRARLLAAERPKAALLSLERSAHGFSAPVFYPHGLAQVYRSSSRLRLDSARGIDDHLSALRHALVSAALHPTDYSLALLRRTAGRTSARLGQRPDTFAKVRVELIEELLRMEIEDDPFHVLARLDDEAARRLAKALPHLRAALE